MNNLIRSYYSPVLILFLIISFVSMLPDVDVSAQIELPSEIESNATEEIPAYIDNINGLRMEYPSNWTKIESIENVIFIAPPQEKFGRDTPELTLAVEHSNETLDELAASYTGFYELVVDNFNIGENSTIDFKGHPARMLTFTSTSANLTPQSNILILVTLGDNRYAEITYNSNSESYPHYSPVVQRMIDSLEIIPTSAPLQQSSAPNITNSSNSSKFEDLYHGLRLEFPSDWRYVLYHRSITGSSIKDVVVFGPPDVNESNPFFLTVGIDDLGSSDVTLEAYTQAKLSQMGQDTIIEQKTTRLSGKPAYQIVYTAEGLTGMRVWTIAENKAVVITIPRTSVFNVYLPVVQRMIDSLEIIPTSAPLQSSSPSISNITNFATYENATNGIKINYPSGWGIIEGTAGIPDQSMCHLFIQCTPTRVQFDSLQEGFFDRVRENVVIFGFILQDHTLEQLVELFYGTYDETLKDFNPLGSQQIRLKDNSTAQMVLYQYSDPSNGITNAVEVYALKGNSAYMIRAQIEPTKYSLYLPVVQRMIDSLEIIPTSAPLQQSSAPNITNSSNFATYENATNGIKINYPSGWGTRETELSPAMRKNVFGVSFISPASSNIDQFQEKLEILTLNPLEESLTLNESVLSTVEDIRRSPSNQNITINDDMLGDIPARTVSYMSTEGEKIQNLELYAKRYDRLYILKFQAHPSEFNLYLPVFRQIIDSFEAPFIPFSNETVGISVDYPVDFMSREGFANDNITGFISTLGSSYNKSFYFVSPNFEEVIEILVENLPSMNITLDDYANAVISYIREEPFPVNIIESIGVELSGLPAKKITYTYSLDGIDTKGTQLITISKDKVYSLVYSAPSSKYSDNTVRELTDSFTIHK